jgi:Zn ribbon nucleic-acid-binding protein
MECPECGEVLKIKKWHDDIGLVEERRECECGHIYHWAYGVVVEISHGKYWEGEL